MPLAGEYLPSPVDHARRQAELFETSRGAEAGELRGVPIVLLTSIGAQTGGLRKTPLMRVEHDGSYAVVASRGGAADHPAWYWNLQANPRVQLQDGSVTADFSARELEGAERELWWQRAVRIWPDYADYQTRTERVIPVFVLEPITP